MAELQPVLRGWRAPSRTNSLFGAFATRARAAGLTENVSRAGSWGRIVNGEFKEVARIDVAEVGRPGWRGKTHIHIDGILEHLPLDTPLP